MKKIITLLAMFITVTAVAQQAPATVKVSKASMKKFSSLYPSATNVTWTVDDAGRYIANFKENDKNRWITIDEKNDWTNSLLEIDKTDLPPLAITQIDQWYDNNTFVKFYKFIDEAGATHYEADRESGDVVAGVIFDKDGNATNKASRPLGERPLRVQ